MRLHNKNAKGQKGLTLIELLVAMVITGFIVVVLGNTITQVITINKQNTNLVTAQRQVQQVGFYLSRDGQQARLITLGNNPTGTGFPVIYSWFDLTGNAHQVTYSLSSGGIVSRSETINGGAAVSYNIASNISILSANTIISLTSPGVYNLKVTALITGRITIRETREYEILQRTS
jgi:prepilin-type N-terminal cleavage/methylation domain-containing protein